MLHRRLALALVVLLLVNEARAATTPWVAGLWFKTFDEDGSPGDFIEFLPNGKAKLFGYCRKFRSGQFDWAKWHEAEGDIYLSIDVPTKGPIALVFRPSQDRSALWFTSPRQRTNAKYERKDPSAACPEK